MPKVQRLEELNLLLTAGSREEQDRVIAGRSQTVGAGMIAERQHLLSLTDEGFDVGLLTYTGDQCRRVRKGVDELLFGAITGGHFGRGEGLFGVGGDLASGQVRGPDGLLPRSSEVL